MPYSRRVMERKNAKAGVKFISKNEIGEVLIIGNTEYLIHSVFSDKSKERFEDKLSKIILKEHALKDEKMSNHFDK